MTARRNPTPAASLALLQRRCEALDAENRQLRNVLFALVKDQGRVRIRKETIASLRDGDGLDAVSDGDCYVVTFKESNMVSGPAGVANGRPA